MPFKTLDIESGCLIQVQFYHLVALNYGQVSDLAQASLS